MSSVSIGSQRQNRVVVRLGECGAVTGESIAAPPISVQDGTVGDWLLAMFAAQIERLLANPIDGAQMGTAARQRVVDDYSWQAHLAVIDRFLPPSQTIAEAVR